MGLPVLKSLGARGSTLAAPSAQRDALRRLPMIDFDKALGDASLPSLRPSGLSVLQVNVGKMCNQTCRHCHVDAGPDRREVMTRQTMEHCLALIEQAKISTVDITGGAPELNPHFRWFVEECRDRGAHVIDRCNLTIMETRSHHDLPTFFADHDVEVVCSLPHYRATHTDRQRGAGVYEKSIRGLRRLNEVGYGQGDPKRRLVLVSNPAGAFMPGSQASLEREWKRELLRNHDVRFDSLFTITNMPISRYLEWLIETDNLESYMKKLVGAFNPLAVSGVMCKEMVSVGWDGRVFDCDFNQMLEMEARALGAGGETMTIASFDVETFLAREIATDRHCFGCTAGSGSSCGGTTT